MRRGFVVLSALLLAGCSSTAPATPSGSSSSGAPPVTGTVTVLAASSLTEVFNSLGKEFEAAHPGTKVTFSYGASSTLAQQIVAGAPADVFAAASPATMATVTKAGLNDGQPKVFARNTLVIAVAPGNPKGITGLADLAKPGTKVALCAPEVPCGAAAKTALSAAKATVQPVTLAPDVKSALSTVELGEADAALVYKTDVKSAGGKVTGVDFPESAQAVNDYPIVALAHAPNGSGAAAFVDFVLGDHGQKALSDGGFQSP
jgi:molybdate transport system substrate-binding protein